MVTFNFGLQLLIDFLSAFFVDKAGYRLSMLIACGAAGAGLISLSFLPDLMPDPFLGIVISIMIYAIGGGLTEVLISPIIEAIPGDYKESAMSLLHAMYSWGSVFVILLSTIFFHLMGTGNWQKLAILWAIIPALDFIMFLTVPIAPVVPDGVQKMDFKKLFSSPIIYVLLIMMICSGASEQAVSQWASTFAESGLNISKTTGDLLGPMLFSVTFGISRTIYGIYGKKINLLKFYFACAIMCIGAYLITVLSPYPLISLAGCAIVGFSVGIFWPGTFSLAASALPGGGTIMYSFLALAGDVGCATGPTVVGLVSSRFSDSLRIGISAAIVFPIILTVLLYIYNAKKRC